MTDGIFHCLPTFAADYSGACGVLYEMGGINILLDASGCAGTVVFLDDVRTLPSTNRFICANLRENEVVLGLDEKIVERVKGTHKLIGGKFVALVGTPVPMIVGIDFDGLAKQVEQTSGVPAIGIDSDGMSFYDVGQTKCYLELIRRFARDDAKVSADVHVIGATPLDMWDLNQTTNLKDLVESCGAKRVASWGLLGSGIEDVACVGASKLNIAVSASGIEVVQELKKLYGTPYIIGFPLGKEVLGLYKSKVEAALKGKNFELEGAKEHSKGGKKALIVADQVFGNALRDYLQLEAGFGEVFVASYFSMNDEISVGGDCHFVEEGDLTEFLEVRSDIEHVFGDPFFRELLPKRDIKFIDLPHAAISGTLTWSRSPNLFGERATLYFEDKLK